MVTDSTRTQDDGRPPSRLQEPTDLVQSVFALLKDVAADNGQLPLGASGEHSDATPRQNTDDSHSSDNTPPTSTPPSRDLTLRLKAFVDDFGSSGVPDEQWIFDSTTYLLSGSASSIRGLCMLTNHRLMFLAHITRDRDEADIVSESFASIHMHSSDGKQRKHKGWLVLDHHILAMHPSKDRPYDTLASLRVASLRDIHLDGEHVKFHAAKWSVHVTFQTMEAASDWLKNLQVTAWLANNSDQSVKLCIPLPALIHTKLSDFHGFGLIFSMDVRTNQNTSQRLVLGFPKQEEQAITTRLAAAQANAPGLYSDCPVPPPRIDMFQSTAETIESSPHKDANTHSVTKLHDFFALPDDLNDVQLFKVEYMSGPPFLGTLVATPTHLCFYSVAFGPRKPVRFKIPVSKIHNAHAHYVIRLHFYGLTVQVDAMPDLHFETIDRKRRDKILAVLTGLIDAATHRHATHHQTRREPSEAEQLAEASLPSPHLQVPHEVLNQLPRMINPPAQCANIIARKHIVCLTIGSRGDVQPYIALCLALMQRGHRCTIVSHPEYELWVKKYGIDYRHAGGDPGLLMKLSVEMNVFSPKYLKTALANFRDWLDELLREIVEQCSDADLIVESPSTFGGIHAAEALGISYMRAFTMPWTKTAAYPQAFCVPKIELGGAYNTASYGMYDQLIWGASSGQINRWRRRMLGLAPTTRAGLHIDRVPFMYNFSPAVVPPPPEWGNLTSVTGYWQIPPTTQTFDPPQDLLDFLAAAKKDGAKVAYIGFGSIILPSPRDVTKAIYEAVDRSGVYAVVSKGWSDRATGDGTAADPKSSLPPLVPGRRVYTVDSIPHDWLLPRIDMALHHGGAGTTGASLAAGCVTLIHPFFGDQFFWANRVEKLGAGLCVSSLKADAITSALVKASTDRIMEEKAKEMQSSMKNDDGVGQACNFIMRYFTRAQRSPRLPQQSSSSSILGNPSKRTSSLLSPDVDGADVTPQLERLSLTEEPEENNAGAWAGGKDAPTSTSTGGYSSRRAGIEDDKRRAALVERWKKEGRDELLARSSPARLA